MLTYDENGNLIMTDVPPDPPAEKQSTMFGWATMVVTGVIFELADVVAHVAVSVVVAGVVFYVGVLTQGMDPEQARIYALQYLAHNVDWLLQLDQVQTPFKNLRAAKNYAYNKEQTINRAAIYSNTQYIDSQRYFDNFYFGVKLFDSGDFGTAQVTYNGCESIAVYNALIALGAGNYKNANEANRSRLFADVLYAMEPYGIAGGILGATHEGAYNALNASFGLSDMKYQENTTDNYKGFVDSITAELPVGQKDVFILSYFNGDNFNDIVYGQGGAHTIMFYVNKEKEESERVCVEYNRDDEDPYKHGIGLDEYSDKLDGSAPIGIIYVGRAEL
jgi:hypothetical protein